MPPCEKWDRNTCAGLWNQTRGRGDKVCCAAAGKTASMTIECWANEGETEKGGYSTKPWTDGTFSVGCQQNLPKYAKCADSWNMRKQADEPSCQYAYRRGDTVTCTSLDSITRCTISINF